MKQIDLNNIDYKNSYVLWGETKYYINNVVKSENKLLVYTDGSLGSNPHFAFNLNGIHKCLPQDVKLFLFYKQNNNHDIVIEYKDLGDIVEIVSIKGIMHVDDIMKKGVKVYQEYFGGTPNMNYAKDNCFGMGSVLVRGNNIFEFEQIEVGKTFPKQTFLKSVEHMKRAALRLKEIVEESKKAEIKRIVI